ncbi:MAG: UDP-N-acetylglucosamine 4,6-dehydratase (inverting) [Rhodospirillales bacterium]
MPDFTDDLNGKSILITGGTGSFGRRFVKHVLTHYRPRKLVVFSRDEMKQWEMSLDPVIQDNPAVRFFIGDVRDQSRLEMAMRDTDIVIHAAALKHVPAAEYNPFECIHTNVLGAEHVVNSAIRCDVGQVIALSTDKAANPINLYGASKLASDKIFIAANNLSGKSPTRFAVVRYGNVVGSRGSVIPLFQKMIRDGADHLPITDERMTRFFITLDQGVAFVLSCLGMMSGGEIFVPKIPSMHITDIAAALAPDLPVRFTGIRPGEKLHEVMIPEDSARNTVEMQDRYVIEPEMVWWSRKDLPRDIAKPVAEDFSYASNTNVDWIDATQLRALIEDEAH